MLLINESLLTMAIQSQVELLHPITIHRFHIYIYIATALKSNVEEICLKQNVISSNFQVLPCQYSYDIKKSEYLIPFVLFRYR